MRVNAVCELISLCHQTANEGKAKVFVAILRLSLQNSLKKVIKIIPAQQQDTLELHS